MPFVVKNLQKQAVPQSAAAADIMLPELVGRSCRLLKYSKKRVPSFTVKQEVVAYASPDSTFAVTKRFLEAARRSILIGIYDMSAPHVKALVLDALGRGVKIKLMLDIDSDDEQELFNELKALGVVGVPAPSCASQNGQKYFRSSHEKVIVIDDEWTLVQSGNYSTHSCPLNVKDGGDRSKFKPGNRDTGLAVRSKEMARFFNRVLSADMALELGRPEAARAGAEPEAFLIERAPARTPATLYASKTFDVSSGLDIQPVLSPDNYMDVVPSLLANATKSILIQQQYIRADQEKIADLVAAIKAAKQANGNLDVRIYLGKVFAKKNLPQEKKALAALKKECGLELGKHIRYVNPDRLVHCHNKMVIIDGKGVLVSSQNWSKAAVWENREAGLWIEHRGIANYFTSIFETDWKDGKKTLPRFPAKKIGPQTVQRGGFVRVSAADYAEV